MPTNKTPSYLIPLMGWGAGGLGLILVAGWMLRPFFSAGSMPLLGAVLAGFASVVVFSIGKIAELLKDEAAKRERIADMVTAIFAELSASDLSADLQEESENIAIKMVQTTVGDDEEPEIPFAVPDDSNFVFEALTSDLSILPQEVIHPVVLYYKLDLQTNAYVRTLQNPAFRVLNQRRRAGVVADLLALNRAQSIQGDRALAALKGYAQRHDIKLPDSEETKARLLRESTPEISPEKPSEKMKASN